MCIVGVLSVICIVCVVCVICACMHAFETCVHVCVHIFVPNYLYFFNVLVTVFYVYFTSLFLSASFYVHMHIFVKRPRAIF